MYSEMVVPGRCGKATNLMELSYFIAESVLRFEIDMIRSKKNLKKNLMTFLLLVDIRNKMKESI